MLPLLIPDDHPAFAGHFPGQPIVPGVVLLDLAQQAITTATGKPLAGLSVAKFHRPVEPGQAISLEFQCGEQYVQFKISYLTHKVADGRFIIRESSE